MVAISSCRKFVVDVDCKDNGDDDDHRESSQEQ